MQEGNCNKWKPFFWHVYTVYKETASAEGTTMKESEESELVEDLVWDFEVWLYAAVNLSKLDEEHDNTFDSDLDKKAFNQIARNMIRENDWYISEDLAKKLSKFDFKESFEWLQRQLPRSC